MRRRASGRGRRAGSPGSGTRSRCRSSGRCPRTSGAARPSSRDGRRRPACRRRSPGTGRRSAPRALLSSHHRRRRRLTTAHHAVHPPSTRSTVPVDAPRRVAGEVADRVGDLLDRGQLGPSAAGGGPRSRNSGSSSIRLRQRRLDERRRDRVDADAVRRPLDAERLRHALDGVLGRAVGDAAGIADGAHLRGEVDDRAARRRGAAARRRTRGRSTNVARTLTSNSASQSASA